MQLQILIDSVAVVVEQLIQFMPKLLAALVIFVAGAYASGLAAAAVRRSTKLEHLDPERRLLIARTVQVAILAGGTVMALQQVEFDLTGFLAGIGIIGFTIGFALQDVSKNFVAGILLLLQQPFDVGDVVEVAGFTGTVLDISARATEMRTLDGLQVIIPNGDVYVSPIKVFTGLQRRRLDVSVGVAYDSDLNLVTRVVSEALTSIPGVLTDESPPAVVFQSFGSSSIDLIAYYWIDLSRIDYLGAKDQAIKAIKAALDRAGVGIPYPIHTVVVRDGRAAGAPPLVPA